MATKPSTTFTHATDTNFSSGPAIGNPTKVTAPTATQGFVPGTGIAAEFINWLFNICGSWIGWLFSGSSAAGEDAHIVETDSTGKTSVAGLVAGGTAAAFSGVVASENSGAPGATIQATNDSNGFALLGTVTGSGAAVRGVSTGAGAALEAVGALNVTGNATLGNNAAADSLTVKATSTFEGDISLDSNALRDVSLVVLEPGNTPVNAGHLVAGAAGALRYQPQATAHYVHTTQKGYVLGAGATESGSITAGNSDTQISQCTIEPSVVGDVVVEVSGYLAFETTGTSARIKIADETAVATLNGSGSGVVEYPIVSGATPLGHSISACIKYTLPSAVSRTFSVTIDALVGDVDYSDMTVKVHGVI